MLQDILQAAGFVGKIYGILDPETGGTMKLDPNELTRVCEYLTSTWSQFRLLKEPVKWIFYDV